jgi:hypothetical protein
MIDEAGRLVMIDLDGFCLAPAPRDVGNFLAYLDWKEIRRPDQAAMIDLAHEAFLDGYQADNNVLDEAWLALYRAASLLKIAGRRYRSLSTKEWPLTPQLLEKAAAQI